MPQEKFPKDYESSVLQRIYERLRQSISKAEKKARDDLRDRTEQIYSSMRKLEKGMLKKISESRRDGIGVPTNIPAPVELAVYELGIWGLAHVSPFLRWKYIGQIKGYEFYGSSNSGFTPHDSAYTQSGIHYGSDSSLYLYTKDASDSTNDFVLDYRLIGKTIENVTQGTSGQITSFRALSPKYGLFAVDEDGYGAITWDTGDRWRITQYPANKLFNIGSLSVFPKRLGNFYVKARTVGGGYNYSDFTTETQSIGWSSTVVLDTPQIVYPIHRCGATCTIVAKGSSDWGRPYCPTCSCVVPWSEITDGTREVDHFLFFGIEWCNIEFVWQAIETEQRGVWYDTRRGVTETEDTEFA